VGYGITVEEKTIEVIATDGIETRKLIWVKQDKDGSFYWGLCIRKRDSHSSYHASGRMQFSKYHEPTIWERISHFKGMRQLCSIAIIRDLNKIKCSHKKFERKKLDGTIYVDFRTLKRDSVGISLHLIEKGHTEFLQSLTKIFPNSTIHLFTFTNPWLATVVY
jgi:hypothetical protein